MIVLGFWCASTKMFSISDPGCSSFNQEVDIGTEMMGMELNQKGKQIERKMEEVSACKNFQAYKIS